MHVHMNTEYNFYTPFSETVGGGGGRRGMEHAEHKECVWGWRGRKEQADKGREESKNQSKTKREGGGEGEDRGKERRRERCREREESR